MIRLTRKVFTDLTIWMIGLGLMMGLAFPFFAVMMGTPTQYVLTPLFFSATMTAGFIVGAANIWLARNVVGNRLHILADHMSFVKTNLREMSCAGEKDKSAPGSCYITVDSEDEIGESTKAFNYLVEALVASHKKEAAVYSFSTMLSRQLDLNILVNEALQQLLQHTDANAGAILVATEGELNLAASQGIRNPGSLNSSDHVRRTLKTLERLCVNLPEDVVIEGVLTDFRPHEVIVDPIHYKRVPLGVIILASASGFTDEVKSTLDLFGQGMALAMNNALTHDRLQKIAALDPLTGIYNRRFGMARLSEEFSRAVRTTGHLGVMMFDIDHFKEVNDTYGHITGDRVLIQVVKAARLALREGDILMRYGGEEFLAILPAASKKNAKDVGERMRRIVEETSTIDGDQKIRVTISLGITSYPELEVTDDQDLIKHADDALYSAKASGRNKVIIK